MFNPEDDKSTDSVDALASGGYWPARAAKHLAEGRLSRALEFCKANKTGDDAPISARLIYAQILAQTGHEEEAAELFYAVLTRDPDNIAALKNLGDIKYARGDEAGAVADYQRVIEIDPHCRGLKRALVERRQDKTTTIKLARPGESAPDPARSDLRSRIPFFTETIGDIYFKQGHARLAAEVFRDLQTRHTSDRIAEKLAKAEQSIKNKDR
jgi:tetratricopeptide (TPR) repeat protein